MRRLPLLPLVLFACREPATNPPTPPTEPTAIAPAEPTPPPDAGSQFAALEQRLLAAQTVRITFAIEAEGSNTADVRGILELGPGGKARIDARGSFAGQAGEAHFVADGRTMKGESVGKRFELASGAALHESILIGLTRMGLLHNIAVLWGGRPPDLAEGGIREWVVTSEHRDATSDGKPAIGFDIVVQGTPMGETTLVLDAAGLPVERSQVVHFPNGDMRVVERYESFEVIGAAAPATTAGPP